MATYATDLNDLTTAESGTWTEFDSPYNAGGTPALDGANFIQGTDCYSQTTGTKSGLVFSIVFDALSDQSGSFAADDVVLMWQFYAVGANVQNYATGGMRLGIGSGTGAWDSYDTGGSDFGRNPYGGWMNVAVDPTLTADDTIGGGNGGAWRYFGSVAYTIASINKGTPHACDAIRYGRAEIYCTGTGCTFTGMAQENDYNDVTNGYNRWGLFQAIQGGYLWKGLMSFGQTGTSATFSDSNKSIFVDDAAKTYLAFNKIEVNHASTSVTWTNITITPEGTLSPGQFEVVDNATVALTNCTFNSMDTFIFQSNSTLDGCTWNTCKQITSGGGDFSNSSVLTSSVAADGYAFYWDESTDPNTKTDGMAFSQGATDHHAMYFGASIPSSITLTDIAFSGFNPADSHNGSTLYFADTTGTITLNLSGVTGTVSIKTAGCTVNKVIDPVDLDVHVDDNEGNDLSGARVYLIASSGTGPLPYQDSVTITRSGTVATVAHTAHGMATNDKVVIKGITDKTEDNYGTHQITWLSADSYSYVTTDSGSTSYTGTIVSTWVALDEDTDVNGDASVNKSYTSNQPTAGWVRDSTSSPRFKSNPIGGDIDNSTGLAINAKMVLDE